MYLAYGFVILMVKMSQEQPPVPMGIVTSDAVRGGRFASKKVAIIVIGVVLLGVLATGAYYLVKYKPAASKTPAPQTTTQLTPAQALAQAKD